MYLQLKHRSVNGLGSVAFEAACDDVEDLLSDGHLLGIVVPRPLWWSHDHVSGFNSKLTVQRGRVHLTDCDPTLSMINWIDDL